MITTFARKSKHCFNKTASDLIFYAFPSFGDGRGDDKRLLADGMDEGNLPGVQADAAVGIAAGSAVFEVAFDGAADVGELAANLMVPAGQQFHLHQVVAFRTI